MGLDMYLDGEKFLWTDWKNPANNPSEDGYQLRSKTLRLGYWRKHPNLHGYIVAKFANGVDNCEPIYLSDTAIEQIIDAVSRDDLLYTEGFFFGESDGTEKGEDIRIFKAALQWLRTEEPGVARSVHYRASW